MPLGPTGRTARAAFDERGQEVRKGSQPYHLSGPADTLDRARRGDVLFYRQPTVAPGRYTLEYVVHDALGAKAGVGIEQVVIEAARAGDLLVSSLAIVSRAERVDAADRDPRNPLYYGDLLLYPNLGDPISKAANRSLTFFYTTYANGKTAHATLELEGGGRVLASIPLALPEPDASGRIQHVAQLPLADVPAGTYALRITVSDGASRVTRTASFTLVP